MHYEVHWYLVVADTQLRKLEIYDPWRQRSVEEVCDSVKRIAVEGFQQLTEECDAKYDIAEP